MGRKRADGVQNGGGAAGVAESTKAKKVASDESSRSDAEREERDEGEAPEAVEKPPKEKKSKRDRKDKKDKKGSVGSDGARAAKTNSKKKKASVAPSVECVIDLPFEVLVCIVAATSVRARQNPSAATPDSEKDKVSKTSTAVDTLEVVDRDHVLPGRDWAALACTCSRFRDVIEAARWIAFHNISDPVCLGEMFINASTYATQISPEVDPSSLLPPFVDGGAALILGRDGCGPWPAGGTRPGDWRDRACTADKRLTKRRLAVDDGFKIFNSGRISEALHIWRKNKVFSLHAAVLAHASGSDFSKVAVSVTKPDSDAVAVAHFLWQYVQDVSPIADVVIDSKARRRGKSMMSRVVSAAGRVLNPAPMTELLTTRSLAPIVDAFMASFDFVNLDIVEALCDVLMFVLPSSVNDAGVLVEAFGRVYFEQNPTYYFASPRAVSNTAYALIRLMLSEDAAGAKRASKSQPSSSDAPKPLRELTAISIPLKKFEANLKGINGDKGDFPTDFIHHLYNRVLAFGLTPQAQREVGRIHKTGWLQKQGTDVLRRWKKRWFVLCDAELQYFKEPRARGTKVGSGIGLKSLHMNSDASNLLGRISLDTATIQPLNGLDTKGHKRYGSTEAMGKVLHGGSGHAGFSFILTAAGAKTRVPYILQCENEREYAEWLALLEPMCGGSISTGVNLPNNGESHSAAHASSHASSHASTHASDSGEALPRISPYFNVSVDEIVERERDLVEVERAAGRPAHANVPLLLSRAFDYLRRPVWLDEEGLLRLSGSSERMQEFWYRIETSPEGPLAVDFSAEKVDPHAVTGMMKLWFRELADGIFNDDQNGEMQAMLKLAGSVGEGVDDMLKAEVKTSIDSLNPAWRISVLRELVDFLRQVTAHSEQNKMTLDNVLRVMTPSMHCAPVFLSLPMKDFDYFFAPPGSLDNVAENDNTQNISSGGKSAKRPGATQRLSDSSKKSRSSLERLESSERRSSKGRRLSRDRCSPRDKKQNRTSQDGRNSSETKKVRKSKERAKGRTTANDEASEMPHTVTEATTVTDDSKSTDVQSVTDDNRATDATAAKNDSKPTDSKLANDDSKSTDPKPESDESKAETRAESTDKEAEPTKTSPLGSTEDGAAPASGESEETDGQSPAAEGAVSSGEAKKSKKSKRSHRSSDRTDRKEGTDSPCKEKKNKKSGSSREEKSSKKK